MDLDSKQIKILTWNANGIKNKKIEFYDFLINNNIQIDCLNETFLKPNILLQTSYFIDLIVLIDPKGGLG